MLSLKCNRCGKDPAAEIHTCTPTDEYRYNLLMSFVEAAYKRGCSLIEGSNCFSCKAKDILTDIGGYSVYKES